MKDKGNRRKRYILLGIFAALALALGIERCADEEPEQLRQQAGESGNSGHRSRTDTLHKPALAASGSLYTHQTTAGPCSRHGRKNAFAAVKDTVCSSSLEIKNATDVDSTVIPTEAPQVAGPDDITGQPQTEPPSSTTVQEETLPTSKYARFPHAHLFRLGIHAGAGYSKTTGLVSIIEGHDVRPTFTMEESGGIVPQIGIFGTWQYGRFGAEAGIDYTRAASKVTEYKQPQAVTETTRFHNDFITPRLLFRFYVLPMFYMGAGFSAAIPFGSRNIDFVSDRDGQAWQQQAGRTQEHLRETLESRVLFSPTIKFGYANSKTGLEAGLEYGFGINDLLHTRPNDYGYRERKNNVHRISLTLGYSIPLNNKHKNRETP